MKLAEKRIQSIIEFGNIITRKLENLDSDAGNDLKTIIQLAQQENPWFTQKNIILALTNWVLALKPEHVNNWVEPYLAGLNNHRFDINVAVVNAGNIPLVGLHDLLSAILCGCRYTGKNAIGDTLLLPYLASVFCDVEPSLRSEINFVSRLEKMDAVIATGNNNWARYFEYYFGKYPHIIRKNRNGIAVLNGDETNEQLHNLGLDIFSYFGLGCRNISKLYVPVGYDFNNFFKAIEYFSDLINHNKYMNNFDYNNSVFLLKKIPFLQNGFLIIRKEKQISSPVSVLHYEEYNSIKELSENLEDSMDQIQCIAANKELLKGKTVLQNILSDFGKTQSPALWDYADGVDTVKFLCGLK